MKTELANFVTVRPKKNGAYRILHVHVHCIDGDVDTTDEPIADNIPSQIMADTIAKGVAVARGTTIDGMAPEPPALPGLNGEAVSVEEMLARR